MKKGKHMILKLDYEELNDIIKCYINKKLKLRSTGDVNIVCSDSEYGQGVTAEILLNYEDCHEGKKEDNKKDNDEKESEGWFGGLFGVTGEVVKKETLD